jgi:hypothetical protein
VRAGLLPVSLDQKPESLFYYCALNTPDRRSWLAHMFSVCEIYFRRRDELNDPNEFRPAVEIRATRQEKLDFIREHYKSLQIKLSPAKRVSFEAHLLRLYERSDWFESLLHEILDGVGVLCLSEIATNDLMWAHYADGHRGICIEFDPAVGLFSLAKRVEYSVQPPVIDIVRDRGGQLIRKGTLIKGDAWNYEREWRVIARPRDDQRIERHIAEHDLTQEQQAFMRQQRGPGYYQFPRRALKSAILGSRVSDDIASWVQQEVAQLGIALRRRAVRVGGRIQIAD